jgi:hypothetical protein
LKSSAGRGTWKNAVAKSALFINRLWAPLRRCSQSVANWSLSELGNSGQERASKGTREMYFLDYFTGGPILALTRGHGRVRVGKGENRAGSGSNPAPAIGNPLRCKGLQTATGKRRDSLCEMAFVRGHR